MVLLTSSIDLDMIESPNSATVSELDAIKIEEFAKLLLLSGDTIRPIILRRVSPIAFQILEGYFEYCAAIKAQEINEQFTAVRAYVVPPELEANILEQYNFLRSLSIQTVYDNSEQKSLISLIEGAIAKQISPLKSSLQEISRGIDIKVSQSQKDLTSGNQVSTLNDLVAVVNSLDKRIPELPEPRSNFKFLEEINNLSNADLNIKISKAGYKGKNLSKLVDLIVKGRNFNSFKDVISKNEKTGQKTMTEATLIKLLDVW